MRKERMDGEEEDEEDEEVDDKEGKERGESVCMVDGVRVKVRVK
jgi:hypothetical protein